MKKIITDYLNETAVKYPNKVAFATDKEEINYDEFTNKSKSIGTYLAGLATFKQPIAIYIDKSINLALSMIGTIYSGGFYTVLDTKSPMDRINQIITTLDCKYIITDDKNMSKIVEEFPNVTIININEAKATNVNQELLDNVHERIIDTDTMYILFTSGSTGVPKGTVLSHRAVISYVNWFIKAFDITSETTFGSQTPFYFSMSVSDVFSTILTGATFYIIPKMYFSFPVKLIEFLEEKKVNTIYWVPSALCILANLGALTTDNLKNLKKVLFAGEVMPTKQLNMWMDKVDAMYANLYGPTETVDICTYYVVNRRLSNDESVPIGKPCDNCDVLIVKEDNTLAQDGEAGELLVRGSFLASGYYKNKEKTNQVFVQNPVNPDYNELVYRTGDIVKKNELGEIIYLSRKDYQIKHMGYRIELGEIESKISAIDGIILCCSIYDEKEDKIILYYQTNSLEEDKLISLIRDKLPTYMVPNVYIKLDRMPYNANGKIDRKELKNKYLSK